MKGMLVGIAAGKAVQTIGVSTQHMVIGYDVGVAQSFNGLGIVLDGGRVIADLGLGKDDADSHAVSYQ
jgi:hypothetical protein